MLNIDYGQRLTVDDVCKFVSSVPQGLTVDEFLLELALLIYWRGFEDGQNEKALQEKSMGAGESD